MESLYRHLNQSNEFLQKGHLSKVSPPSQSAAHLCHTALVAIPESDREDGNRGVFQGVFIFRLVSHEGLLAVLGIVHRIVNPCLKSDVPRRRQRHRDAKSTKGSIISSAKNY